ncbi:MAG TPA: pirin family protein [Polyangia bacterium]|nr:pirin family protein [Polyangia bacterium]
MMTIKRGCERGHGQFGWLDSFHTFSFGHYFDPKSMGFSDLRVLNENRVAAGEGFPTHSHRDIEMLTYVLDGALEYKDSCGGAGVIRYGDVQRMSAGAGVTCAEHNASMHEPVHMLEIWLRAACKGAPAGYEGRHFAPDDKRGRLRVIAAPDGAEGALTIGQDARVYASILDNGAEVIHTFAPGRKGWVHVARGAALVGGQPLRAGDGAALVDEATVTLAGRRSTELLLFDLQP